MKIPAAFIPAAVLAFALLCVPLREAFVYPGTYDVIFELLDASVVMEPVLGEVTVATNLIVNQDTPLDIDIPIVIRLTGTNEAEGVRILEEAGFSAGSSMDEVVENAVQLAAQA